MQNLNFTLSLVSFASTNIPKPSQYDLAYTIFGKQTRNDVTTTGGVIPMSSNIVVLDRRDILSNDLKNYSTLALQFQLKVIATGQIIDSTQMPYLFDLSSFYSIAYGSASPNVKYTTTYAITGKVLPGSVANIQLDLMVTNLNIPIPTKLNQGNYNDYYFNVAITLMTANNNRIPNPISNNPLYLEMRDQDTGNIYSTMIPWQDPYKYHARILTSYQLEYMTLQLKLTNYVSFLLYSISKQVYTQDVNLPKPFELTMIARNLAEIAYASDTKSAATTYDVQGVTGVDIVFGIQVTVSDKYPVDDNLIPADLALNEEAIKEDMVQVERTVNTIFARAIEVNITYFNEVRKQNPNITLGDFTLKLKAQAQEELRASRADHGILDSVGDYFVDIFTSLGSYAAVPLRYFTGNNAWNYLTGEGKYSRGTKALTFDDSTKRNSTQLHMMIDLLGNVTSNPRNPNSTAVFQPGIFIDSGDMDEIRIGDQVDYYFPPDRIYKKVLNPLATTSDIAKQMAITGIRTTSTMAAAAFLGYVGMTVASGGVGLLPAGLQILQLPAQFYLAGLFSSYAGNMLSATEWAFVGHDRDSFYDGMVDYNRNYAGPSSGQNILANQVEARAAGVAEQSLKEWIKFEAATKAQITQLGGYGMKNFYEGFGQTWQEGRSNLNAMLKNMPLKQAQHAMANWLGKAKEKQFSKFLAGEDGQKMLERLVGEMRMDQRFLNKFYKWEGHIGNAVAKVTPMLEKIPGAAWILNNPRKAALFSTAAYAAYQIYAHETAINDEKFYYQDQASDYTGITPETLTPYINNKQAQQLNRNAAELDMAMTLDSACKNPQNASEQDIRDHIEDVVNRRVNRGVFCSLGRNYEVARSFRAAKRRLEEQERERVILEITRDSMKKRNIKTLEKSRYYNTHTGQFESDSLSEQLLHHPRYTRGPSKRFKFQQY